MSNLPPLPEPAFPEVPVFGESVDVYTDEQMHAYALQYAAQVEAERDALREDAERLRAFEDWVADRHGLLLHIEDVRNALLMGQEHAH